MTISPYCDRTVVTPGGGKITLSYNPGFKPIAVDIGLFFKKISLLVMATGALCGIGRTISSSWLRKGPSGAGIVCTGVFLSFVGNNMSPEVVKDKIEKNERELNSSKKTILKS